MTATETPVVASRIDAGRLARFMKPRSVAIIGASESSPRYAVRALLESDLDVYLVNPNRPTVFGRPAYDSLTSIGHPVDAVLTLVNANAAVEVVAQASAAGCGGVAINAAGFSEVGEAGAELQHRLIEAAGSMAVLGPNCNGFVTVESGAFLAGAPKLPLRSGGVGLVTHSGGYITDVAVSAVDRQIGFSSLISTGNEANTDLTDYVDFLVDDPSTTVITLVIERIKRPEAFFAATRRAAEAGKPVIALKLGRSERGREVAKSHTGSILGDPWIYDAAFRQHGIILARDLDDLLDRAMLFDQLPREKWSPVEKLAILTVSGGAASLASDIADDEAVNVPDLSALLPRIQALLPTSTANPLDMTGFVMSKPDLIRSIIDAYLESNSVDAILALWTLGVEAAEFAQAFTHPFADAARTAGVPIFLSAVANARVSPWAVELRESGLAVSHGLRGSIRALGAMAEFARFQRRLGEGTNESAAALVTEAPKLETVVQTTDGAILGFDAAMRLLASAGLTVAPYAVVAAEADLEDLALPDFPAPFVVKIADCPHRTEVEGVRVGVSEIDVKAAIQRMRGIASSHGYSRDVVIQPMLSSSGELFIGGQTEGELGAMVVAGIGGIHVEAMGAVSGRVVPIGTPDARAIISEFDRAGHFAGTRGKKPWDEKSALGSITSVSEILDSSSDWLLSIDINPLMLTDDGFVAVDALVFVR